MFALVLGDILILCQVILILFLLPRMLIFAFDFGLASRLMRQSGQVVVLFVLVLYFEFCVALVVDLVFDDFFQSAGAFLHFYAFLEEVPGLLEVLPDALAKGRVTLPNSEILSSSSPPEEVLYLFSL